MSKILIVFSLLLSIWINPFNRIAEINKNKKAAREAIHNGEYDTAIKHYQFLTDSLNIREANVYFNLGNAHFHQKDSLAAMQAYQEAFDLSTDSELKADVKNQMGIIAHKMGKHKDALEMFKNALRNNPNHEDARFNYELLKKLTDEQDQDQDNQDGDNQDNQDENDQDEDGEGDNKDNKDGDSQDGNQDENSDDEQDSSKDGQDEGDQEKDGDQQDGDEQENEQKEGEDVNESGDEKKDDINPSTAEKLKEMNMTEEKAQMILEAMRNAESQYIQQLKKKPTKKADPKMPDW